jgi:hypothetical protein
MSQAALLEDAPRYSRAKGYFSAVQAQIATSRAKIEEVAAQVLIVDGVETIDTTEFSEVTAVKDAVENTRIQIQAAMTQALRALDALDVSRKNP